MSGRSTTLVSIDGAGDAFAIAARQVIERSLADVRGHDAVELGCGTGRHLATLAALGAGSLVGCDMTQPISLPPRSADLVLICQSLEHVAELGPPLVAARRLIRRLGWVAVIESHPFLAQGARNGQRAEGGVGPPVHAHRFADYLNGFAEAGLRVETCREWRACDLGADVPHCGLRESPLLVEFYAVPA